MLYCKEIVENKIGDNTSSKKIAESLGWTITIDENNIEQAYDGSWYVKGYAPSKPQEVKEEEVRAVRAKYFEDYVDWYQEKQWLLEEMTEEEINDIKEYRQYLKDYTSEEEWWEKNPMDFETWKEQKDLLNVENEV